MRVNAQKTVVILASLACLTLFVLTGAAAMDAVLPLFTMIVGYAVGNGIGAATSPEGRPAPLIERNVSQPDTEPEE